ncbi:MAG: hypothetical protein IJ619_10485 [Eubacterium sp.]|nr:hypothetical protein [Eubacterium sp.]
MYAFNKVMITDSSNDHFRNLINTEATGSIAIDEYTGDVDFSFEDDVLSLRNVSMFSLDGKFITVHSGNEYTTFMILSDELRG